MTPTPALFASHGAAVFTTAPADPTGQFLSSFAPTIAQWVPRAIVVISAHYSEHPVQITGPGALGTIHDHPVQAMFSYRYPARGAQELCSSVTQVLQNARIAVELNDTRGLDHGAWVPLSRLRPDADLPVMQLSLDARGSPSDHIALGAALASLRDERILLLGSGGITHNQNEFRRGYFAGSPISTPATFSRDFDRWVSSVLTTQVGEQRLKSLTGFTGHPLAREAHPTIEHFLPLLVIAGAAQNDHVTKVHEGFQHSLSTSAYQFG